MIDNYGRSIDYLRLSVTDLCNLRCRYCMPAHGACNKDRGAVLSEEELIDVVRVSADLGVTKLRITGGEPLIREDILSICRQAAAVPGIDEVTITTNGILLAELAHDLRQCGVSRLNISLDTLDPEKYTHITRGGQLSTVLSGLDAALSAGFQRIKINAVLIGGFNDDEISDLAELSVKYPVDVRFIELMPMVEDGAFAKTAYLPCTEVLRVLPQAEPVASIAGTARLYRLPDGLGNIGLITPVSDHFCHCCNRIRVTADGRIKPCLHSGEEYSLKGLSVEEMKAQLLLAVSAKPSWHGELGPDHPTHAGRNMNTIGG